MGYISRVLFPIFVIVALLALVIVWYGNAFWAKWEGFIVEKTDGGFILAREGETFEKAKENKKAMFRLGLSANGV